MGANVKKLHNPPDDNDNSLLFQNTNKKPMVMVRVVKDHDLVIEFSYVAERKKFLAKLENFLQSHKKSLETVPCFRDHMLMNAETKEKRKLR